jgi:hypothetical protein
MEGISLPAFIHQVKLDLIEAEQNPGIPYFHLQEVNLEVSFVVDATAKGGLKIFVLEAGAETSTQLAHKVSIKLTPILRHSDTGPDEPSVMAEPD